MRQIGRRMIDSPSTVDHAVTVLVVAHPYSATQTSPHETSSAPEFIDFPLEQSSVFCMENVCHHESAQKGTNPCQSWPPS